MAESKEYFERFVPDHSERWSDLIACEHFYRYKWVKDKISGTVLDLGCGEGYGTNELRLEGIHITGMDHSKEAVDAAIKKYGNFFVAGDICNIPLESETYDTIICFEVLEHIHGIEQALKEIFRILKKGGRFILSTPNAETNNMKDLNPDHVKEIQDSLILLTWVKEVIIRYIRNCKAQNGLPGS
jgi:2-polyprenyl-3-methyl-5-hydroxy-6-metoxy-1,4-benzoquinol methylase